MGQYRVTEDGDGLRLRVAPYLSSEILGTYPTGTVVTAGDYAWRAVAAPDGTVGWMADRYLEPVSTADAGDSGGSPDGSDIASDTTADRLFTLADLWPLISQAADQYAHGDPIELARGVAAILYQESGFRNWRVHADGTGHGLAGLDDNGMLPDFEAWAGRAGQPFAVGRGANAAIIPVGLQIEYVVYAIDRYAITYGTVYLAARAWYRGPGQMNDALGQHYEQLIRQHVATLFG